eukprot:CAMPEP_0201662324 /NCGR_PEP_ID=MMETSP0494-20130426/4440_1 /ASSEMBLY_ACC=CAM_ASM_000839 /TAXON_ID=420259 /ORGANISM="Thalassiosira gravida, Strain GMp14c1" /LENGTH=372 /DNA_ID=CAMNT_0048140653 /DNA_START=52 /DNA_END=1170 /DNA_ORIENTATION=-
MGGDDLASDDEYLFDTVEQRGTAISSDDDNGNNNSSDDDDDNNNNNTTSQKSKKRKGSELTATTDTNNTAISEKKRKKKKKKIVPTNSKNILIHAGRGIAMDGVEAQAMFLGTIYKHSLKMMESGVGGGTNTNNDNDDNKNNDDDGGEGGKDDAQERNEEDKNQSTAIPFSFEPHLYTPPHALPAKTQTYRHANLDAFLKSGPLPSAKRLKNWNHPHSPMVLIVTLSARRSVELTKQLSSLKLPVAKLFAKHLCLEDQVELLRGGVKNKSGGGGDGGGGGGGGKKRARCYSLAVGTPGRLLKLLRHGREEDGGGGALRLKHTELVVFDCHEDSKGWTVCTLKDTSRELMEFTKEGVVGELEKRKGKIKLAMF